MVEPIHLLWASLSAALVTLLGTGLLANWLRRNEERRRERRAFAEAALCGCDILDDIVVRHWGTDRDDENRSEMEILRKRLMAELGKIIGLIAISRLTQDEQNALSGILNKIYDKMLHDFEVCPCAASAARVGDILAEVIRIRLEVNKMRAG